MNGSSSQLSSSKQQIQNQAHTYLSAIRDLQSADAEENLKKKREQQIAFAESLRKQIDEKRQRKQQQQNQKYNINQFKDGQQRNEPHFTFGEETSNFQPNISQPKNFEEDVDINYSFSMNFDSLSSKPIKIQSNHTRKQLFTKADLSQFDLFSSKSGKENSNFSMYRPAQIQINTDSPFASSTVSTPPQGFSMRHPQATQPFNSQFQVSNDQNVFQTPNYLFENSISNYQNPIQLPRKQNQMKFNYQDDSDNLQVLQNKNTNAKLSHTITKKTNYRPPQVQPRAKSMLLRAVEMKNTVQLNGVSELVYPDGHLSPAISPRDASF